MTAGAIGRHGRVLVQCWVRACTTLHPEPGVQLFPAAGNWVVASTDPCSPQLARTAVGSLRGRNRDGGSEPEAASISIINWIHPSLVGL